MKKFLSLFSVIALIISSLTFVPIKAVSGFKFDLNAEVTNSGQNIYQVVIDYKTFTPEAIDNSTFTVIASGSSENINDGAMSYGDFKDVERTIVNTKIDGTKVILTLKENETGSSTLAYLDKGRNVPLDLTYQVKQNKAIQGTSLDGREMEVSKNSIYVWNGSTNNVNGVIHDTEVDKFISIKDKINYQFYKPSNQPENRPLIVWFHGNGEGDYNHSQNNVAQMLANRGTVAWATDQAQQTFDNAYVMAFQSPDTWYYAQAENYLETTYQEIQKVIKQYHIDTNRVYVAGCSAGGYMTTRMIIEYPDLFAAANIICPALDVATERGGQTPTDEELMTLKDANTKIWLVQADDDTTVKTKECARRIYNLIGEGDETITTISGGKTFEKDNITYTEYTTIKDSEGKSVLPYQEDTDKDGIKDNVTYSNHWSWIFALNNEPMNAKGEHLWTWLSHQKLADTTIINGTQTITIDGFEWGPGVTKTTIKLDQNIQNITKDMLKVVEEKTAMMGGLQQTPRTITDAYLSDENGNKVEKTSNYITINMSVNPEIGNPFNFSLETFLNTWCEVYDLIITTSSPIYNEKGEEVQLNIVKTPINKVKPLADQFNQDKFIANDDMELSYGYYQPQVTTSNKLPLIIWLHGAGEGGSDNDIVTLGNEVTALIDTPIQNYFKQGAWVLTPQAPTMWMDNGNGYTTDGSSIYTENLMSLIDQFVKEHQEIDPNRIYIGGCSNGGFMTMNMIINYPDYFAAAYPICEAYDDSWISDEQIQAIKDIPIWFTHALNDTTVDPQKTTLPTYERLLAVGADVHKSIFDDVHDTSGQYFTPEGNPYQYNGHWSWIYTFNNECKDNDLYLFEWLASKTLATEPIVTPDPIPDKEKPTDQTQPPKTSDNTMLLAMSTFMGLSLLGYVLLKKEDL